MQCKQCGQEVADDARFCTNCGAEIAAEAPIAAAPSEKEQIKAFKEAEKAKKAEEKAQKEALKAEKKAKKAEKRAKKAEKKALKEQKKAEKQAQLTAVTEDGEFAPAPAPQKKGSAKWILILIVILAMIAGIAALYFLYINPFIKSFSQDNTFLYMKDDAYYYYNGRRAKQLKDEKEIAEHLAGSVTTVPGLGVQADGMEWTPAFYYNTEAADAIDATALVQDDYAEEDAALTEPDREAYKKTGTFFGFEFETYDNAAYNEAQKAYLKKTERDGIRDALSALQVSDARNIYYYDAVADKETLLAENVLVRSIAAVGDTDVYSTIVCIPLTAFPADVAGIDEFLAEGAHTLMSDYLNRYMRENAVEATLFIRDQAYTIAYRQNETYLVDVPNKNLYHLERKEDQTVEYLERAPLSQDKAGTFKTIDDDFGNAAVPALTGFVAGSRFYYTKNYDQGTHKSDLCLDGDVVATDVYHVMQHTNAEGAYEDVLYVKQGSNALRDGSFNLSEIDGKRQKTWCEDAVKIKRLEDGSFAVLKNDGTLVRVTRPAREKKIDTDVTELFGASGALADNVLMMMQQPILNER